MPHYFISATDTDAGKTYIGEHLLKAAARRGLSSLGFKPIASGCERQCLENGETQLFNDDVLKLQAAASIALDYQQINCYSFEPAIAPHIAAKQLGVDIELAKIQAQYQALMAEYQPQFSIFEAAGGWLVPLNETMSVPELAKAAGLEIILVVKIKLGCINHALLSLESIQARGLPIKGWIANGLLSKDSDNWSVAKENIESIKKRTQIPLLGVISQLESGEDGDEGMQKNNSALAKQREQEFDSLLAQLV